jgi:hypothetical protein
MVLPLFFFQNSFTSLYCASSELNIPLLFDEMYDCPGKVFYKMEKKTRIVLSLIYLEIYIYRVVEVIYGIKKVKKKKILANKLDEFSFKK